MYKKVYLIIVSYLLVFPAIVHSAEQSLSVENAWIRLVPPVAVNTAGYFKITNTSDKKVTIVSAESDVAKKTEIHDMKMENGGMSMVHVPRLTLAPGETIGLKPGGKHLMLIGLHKPLKKDQVVSVTFKFEDGTSQVISFPVLKSMKQEKMKHHH